MHLDDSVISVSLLFIVSVRCLGTLLELYVPKCALDVTFALTGQHLHSSESFIGLHEHACVGACRCVCGCGCVGVWVCGCVGVWVCGYVGGCRCVGVGMGVCVGVD